MIYNLTNKELDSLLKDCSSVEKEIKLADGTMADEWIVGHVLERNTSCQ